MRWAFIFYVLMLSQTSYSQNESFQIVPDSLIGLPEIVVNRNGDFGLIGFEDFFNPKLSFFILDDFSDTDFSSKKIRSLSHAYHFIRKAHRVNDVYAIYFDITINPWAGNIPSECKTGTAISIVNPNDNTAFAKCKEYHSNGSGDFDVDVDNNIITAVFSTNTPYEDTAVVELRRISLNGDPLMTNGIEFLDAEGLLIQNIRVHPDEFYILNGRISPSYQSFILKVDFDGNPIQGITIEEGHSFSNLEIDEEGNIYGLGVTDLLFSFTENVKNASFIKLDKDLNTLESKIFYAEEFEYKSTTLRTTSDGNLIIGYSTFGAFPVILSKLTKEGNIIWQRGYPLYEPIIEVFPSGALAMLARRHFNENGEVFNQNILSKTDSLGFIEGCETFETCLEVADISINTGVLNVQSFGGIEDFDHEDLIVEDTSFTFSDFCDTPPPPNPMFNLPDTICIGDCTLTSGVYNQFAHGIEWHLSGVNTDSILADSLNFKFCFTEAGEYALRQTVWFLGCDYFFEKNIVVLDDLTIDLLPEGIICEVTPLELFVESDRPVVYYEWNSGELSPTLEISNSGYYSVTVSDGICEMSDSSMVDFIFETITETPLTLPDDTLVCDDQLPFLLLPESPYSDSFYIDGGTQVADGFYLNDSGAYQISTIIQGCVFSETFKLETDLCLSKVYLPNVFSPNGDAVNDEFFPQGKYFETILLEVYDRWGGQVFKGTGDAVKWDGKKDNEPLPSGVYAFRYEFINTLTGVHDVLTGGVILIR